MNPSIRFFLLLLGSFSTCSSILQAQSPSWQSTEGPYHGTANCFIKGPNNYLYAGTEVGVFRTPIDQDAWELMSDGILDREVVTLTTDSSGVLYAGTAEGAFRSFDEGAHWEIVNFGLGNTNVHAVQAAPHGVLLAGTDKGIYRSTDQATSWQKATTDSADTSVLCLGVHPSGALYAGTPMGLMRSSDHGEHWSLVERTNSYFAISINRRGIIAVVLKQHTNVYPSSVGISRDSGATFAWDLPEPDKAVCVALDDSDHLFVGGASADQESDYGHLWRYNIDQPGGGGHTWRVLNTTSSAAGPIRSVFASGERVFASGADVICSTDTGATYHDFMRGLTAYRVLSLSDNTKRTVFAGTQFAMFHRTDTASSWSPHYFLDWDNFTPQPSMAADSTGLMVAGTNPPTRYGYCGFAYSTDFGVSWQWGAETWAYVLQGPNQAVALSESGQWFAAGAPCVLGGRFNPMSSKKLLTTASPLVSLTIRDSTELYAGSVDGEIYCSYDTGTTWQSTQLVPAVSVQSLVAASGGRVYAGTSGGFFTSSDRGSSWAERGGGEVPSNIRVLVAKLGVGIFAGTSEGVYRSSDEGEHWQACNDGLAVTEIYSLCFGSDGSLYAGTSGAGVYRLPSETMLSVELSSFSVAQAAGGSVHLDWVTASEVENYGFEVERRLLGAREFVSLPNSFRAGHGTTTETHEYNLVDTTPGIGQWQYRLKQIDIGGGVHYSEALSVQITTDVKGESELPTTFALQQNYPNPFNPTTTVEFDVPHTRRVSILIYDLLGRQVAHLVDGIMEAGRHRLTFSADALASGVYVLRMQAGAFTESRKIVLLR